MRFRDYSPAIKFGARIYPEDLAVGMGVFGDVFYVDYLNGSDTANSGTAANQAFKTLGAVHGAATTNKNDVAMLNGNGTHIQEAEMLTWSKNRIHVFGVGPFGAVDPQPEIQLSSTGNAADNAATMKVTGYGNTFTNIYVSNNGTHANSVTALWDAGENNVYTNTQFAKFSDLNVAGVSNVEARGDTTTWRNCKYGVDWVTVSAARFGMLIKGTGGSARMKHNIFEDCNWAVATSSADYEHIHVYDTNSLAFGNTWRNDIFNNAIVGSISAAAIDDAVASVSGLTEGSMLFVNPACNATSFATITDQLTVVGLSMNGGADTAFVGVAITPA